MDTARISRSSKTFSRILLGLGALLGVVSASFALSEDAEGQVNLFGLLFLFIAVPLVSLFFSLYALQPRGLQINWLDWLLKPVSSTRTVKDIQAVMQQASVKGYGRYWFIYQAQIFYLAFYAACALTYLVILTFSHVAVSWSSTLFAAEDFLPYLQLFASPWYFWQAAQPSTELLACTNQARLGCSEWHWWLYVFAALLAYGLIPRCFLWFFTHFQFYRQLKKDEHSRHSQLPQQERQPPPRRVPNPGNAAIVNAIASPYLLIIWDSVPGVVQQYLAQQLPPAKRVVQSAKLSAAEVKNEGEQSVVILTRGSQPPMKALKDYVQQLPSFPNQMVLPLDWDDQRLVSVAPGYLNMWQRVLSSLPGWAILQTQEAP